MDGARDQGDGCRGGAHGGLSWSCAAETTLDPLVSVDDVAAAADQMSVPGRAPVPCGAVCAELQSGLDAGLTATATEGEALSEEFLALVQDAGTAPSRAKLIAQRFGLVGGAVTLGMLIRNDIQQFPKFFGIPTIQDTPSMTSVSLRVKGDGLINGSSDINIVAPSLGLVGQNAQEQTVHWETFDLACSTTSVNPPIMPEGFPIITQASTGCPFFYNDPAYGRYYEHFPFYPVRWRLTDPPADFSGPTITWPPAGSVSFATAKGKILSALTTQPGQYQTLIKSLNYHGHVPGAVDPITGDFNMPDCSGRDFTACESLLESYGITDVYARYTLDEQLSQEEDDRTVSTQPAAGEHIEGAANAVQAVAALKIDPTFKEQRDRPCDYNNARSTPAASGTYLLPDYYRYTPAAEAPGYNLGFPTPTLGGPNAALRHGFVRTAAEGYRGWGYDHIAAKHGWNAEVAARAKATLLAPTAPPVRSTADDAVDRYIYLGAEPKPGSSLPCLRVALAERSSIGEFMSGLPYPVPGIWSSYEIKASGAKKLLAGG